MRAHLLVGAVASRPAAWSEFLFDGTSGTDLNAYTPDQGTATLGRHASTSAKAAQIDGSGLAKATGTSSTIYLLSANAPTEDVTTTVTFTTGTSGGSSVMSVWMRLGTASSLTGYRATHNAAGTAGSARSLVKSVAGATTTLASWGNAAPSSTITWTMSIIGNVITVKEGGSTVATTDETSNTPITSGRVGLMWFGTIVGSIGAFDTVTTNFA